MTKKITVFSKRQAVAKLSKYDHAFLKPEMAIKICEPFGFTPRLQTQTDSRSEFKGLTLFGINPKTGKEFVEGDTCEGIAAHTLAMQICNHVKVQFQDCFGIGSQLSACCKALNSWLDAGSPMECQTRKFASA